MGSFFSRFKKREVNHEAKATPQLTTKTKLERQFQRRPDGSYEEVEVASDPNRIPIAPDAASQQPFRHPYGIHSPQPVPPYAELLKSKQFRSWCLDNLSWMPPDHHIMDELNYHLPCYCISLPHHSYPTRATVSNRSLASPPRHVHPYSMRDTMMSFHHRLILPAIYDVNHLLLKSNPKLYDEPVRQMLLDGMPKLPVEMISMVLDYAPITVHTDCSQVAPFLFQGTCFYHDPTSPTEQLLERFEPIDTLTRQNVFLLLAGQRLRGLRWHRQYLATDPEQAEKLVQEKVEASGLYHLEFCYDSPDYEGTIFTDPRLPACMSPHTFQLEPNEFIIAVSWLPKDGLQFDTNRGRSCRVATNEFEKQFKSSAKFRDECRVEPIVTSDDSNALSSDSSASITSSSNPTPSTSPSTSQVWTIHAPIGFGLVGLQKRPLHSRTKYDLAQAYLVCIFGRMVSAEIKEAQSSKI